MAAPPHLMLKCPFCGQTFEAPINEGWSSSHDNTTGEQIVTMTVTYSMFHACPEAITVVP
jgi:hypothetical protein